MLQYLMVEQYAQKFFSKKKVSVENMDQNYPYSIVEKISFIRYGGTEEEKRAAALLMEEIEAAGGKGSYMPFEIPKYTVEKCAIVSPEPYAKQIETVPYGLSGSLPEGGVDLKLYYAGRGVEEDYIGMDDLSDTVVLVNELKQETYELLCQKKAGAFITLHGKYYDNLETANVYKRCLRSTFVEKGKIPGFMIAASEAMELVRHGVKTLHLELIQKEETAESQNVLATIPGTIAPEEIVVLTAHYDSVPVGTGSWDNATGSAALMYIYRYFMQNPPRRTMQFIWCGSEEQGLLGSRAYVEQHEEQVKKMKFCFNFDMCGTVLGPNLIFVTGGDELINYVKQFCREKGMSADIQNTVHSSDSAPFCDKGVPAIGLSRGTRTAEIHTRYDLIKTLSPSQLRSDAEFAVSMIERAVNSVQLPVDTGMNENMRKELDKYFKRKNEEKKD